MFFELRKRSLKFGEELCDGLVELCKGFRGLQPPLGLEFAELFVHGKAEVSEFDELLPLALAELGCFVQGFASLKKALLCVIECALLVLVVCGQGRTHRRRRKRSGSRCWQGGFDLARKWGVAFVEGKSVFFAWGKSVFFVWGKKRGGRRGRCCWVGSLLFLGGEERRGRGAEVSNRWGGFAKAFRTQEGL